MGRYSKVHENPQGAGDARTTAYDIIKDTNTEGKLSSKVAVVTGISSGIGIDTALALRQTGMRVIGAVRNIPKAEKALEGHIQTGKLDLVELDNSSLDSVRAAAQKVQSMTDRLDILVLNAGIMYTPYSRTVDGHERQFGTNHLAHFLFFQLLKPLLISSATPVSPSRVVALSSVAHRDANIDFNMLNKDTEETYNRFVTYGNTKLANLWTAVEIARRYKDKNLLAFGVMPGNIESGLQSEMPQEVMAEWAADKEFVKTWKTTAQGAATTVWAAVNEEDELVVEGNGKYLEDCHVSEPLPAEKANLGAKDAAGTPGYAKFAYDAENAKKLWELSCEWVGVEDKD